ncbi:MAG: DUF559 domain-containing protein [Patescibacteria group bacterium]|jgi:very-short-patch-repair endonuclease
MFVRTQKEYKQIQLQHKLTERAKLFRHQSTVAENKLWQRLRRHQLAGFKFRRQHPLFQYIVDFYCFELRLIIEVDGKVHENQIPHDIERTIILERHDFKVLRFTNDQVINDIETVIDVIQGYF